MSRLISRHPYAIILFDMRIILSTLANSLSLIIAAYLIGQIRLPDSLLALILIGLAIAIANFFVKPILKILSFPIIILTFGIFSFFISMAILWSIDQLFIGITINGFIPLIITTALIGIANTIFCHK